MAVFQQLADEFVQELLKIHCHELTSTTSRIESRRAIEALSLSCRFLSHLAQPFLFAHLSSHQVENRMAHRDHEQATPEYVKDRLGLFRSPRYSPFVRYVRIGFSVSEINRQPLETVWRSWGILEALPSFLKLAVIDLANVTLDRGQLEALSRVGSNVLFCRLTVCSLEEGSTIPATLQIRARKVELCGNSHPHDRSEPFIPFFLSSKQTRELSIRGVRDVALTLHSLTLYPEAAAQVEVLQLRFKTSRPFSDSALSPVLSMFTSLRRLKFTGWIRGAAPGLAAINPIPSTALQSLEALDTWLESVTFFSQLPNVKDVYFMGLATRLHVHANSPLVRPFFSRLERLCFQLAVVANEDLRSMSAALKDAFSNLSWLEIEMSSTDTPIWVCIEFFSVVDRQLNAGLVRWLSSHFCLEAFLPRWK